MDERTLNQLAPSLQCGRDEYFQLLRFVPLLAVIWADGVADAAEVELFKSFVDRFIRRFMPRSLDPDEAMTFFGPFLGPTLASAQHRELIRLFHHLLEHYAEKMAEDRRLDLFRLGHELALAARTGTDCGEPALAAEEQVLLLEMIQALRFSPQTEQDLFRSRSARLFELRPGP